MPSLHLYIYAPLIACSILVVASVMLLEAKMFLPFILIGVSSLGLLFLNIINFIQNDFYSEDTVHTFNSNGAFFEGSFEFSIWQNILSWLTPFAIVAIAVGVFILCKNQLKDK